MNGVMSNGVSPVARLNVGSMFSENWTKQAGHHASTWPVLDCESFWIVLPDTREDVSRSPAPNWKMPQQCDGPPITR